jgi:hypothetical protein
MLVCVLQNGSVTYSCPTPIPLCLLRPRPRRLSFTFQLLSCRALAGVVLRSVVTTPNSPPTPKPRQALMWKCLRRRQRDQAWHERKRAAEVLAARFQRAAARPRHGSTLAGAALLLSANARATARRQHVQARGAACLLEAGMRATAARDEWKACRAAGNTLVDALEACLRRNRAANQLHAMRHSALVCALAWRRMQARRQLEQRRRLQQEHAARVRLERARAQGATCLEASINRWSRRCEWRCRVGAARALALANLRCQERRALSVAVSAGSVINCQMRAALARRQMTTALGAVHLLVSTHQRFLARNYYRRRAAGFHAAAHMVAGLHRTAYMRRYSAARHELLRAAAGHVVHAQYHAFKSAACGMRVILQSCNQRREYVGRVFAALVLGGALRRKPARASFALAAGGAAAIRRGILGKLARAELKRRRDQRARDALLAPALVPSKQPALHEHLSPCPPRAARPADAQGPPGFRKRLIHSGPAATYIFRPESIAPPLKGCKALPNVRDDDDGEKRAEDDDAREGRLLQQQQQRISEDISRAGGARAPKDSGILPHEVVQGGAGAALLALRTRSRG